MLKPEIKRINTPIGLLYDITLQDINVRAGYDINGLAFSDEILNLESVGLKLTRIYCRLHNQWRENNLTYCDETKDYGDKMRYIATLGHHCQELVCYGKHNPQINKEL